MKRVLLTTFDGRAAAAAAQRQLDGLCSPATDLRLHEGEVEVQLSSALDATAVENADERNVTTRFGLAFGITLAIGIGLDWIDVLGHPGMPMTMAFGSLGVFFGMIAVLLAELRPIDTALAEVRRRLQNGHVLLTVPVHDRDSATAEEIVRRYRGQVVFTA